MSSHCKDATDHYSGQLVAFKFGSYSVQIRFKDSILFAAIVETREDTADGLRRDIEPMGNIGAVKAITNKQIDQQIACIDDLECLAMRQNIRRRKLSFL